jgi:hypothetical protein
MVDHLRERINAALMGGGAVQPLILDEFIGATGSLITNHTISPINTPAATWAYIGGYQNQFKISGNKAVGWALGEITIAADAGVADCSIQADIDFVAGTNNIGLCFRVTDIQNLFIAYITAGNILRIASVTDNVPSNLYYTILNPVPANGTYPLKITLSGSLITWSFAGQTASVTSTARQTVTKHGLYCYFSGTNTLDNFRIAP